MSKKKQRTVLKATRKSFTLVETMLAVTILSMAIIAPLSIASNSLTAATTGKDRLVAIALARDAIEYVRNLRDTNRLNGVSWLNGLDNNNCINGSNLSACNLCFTANGCEVDSLQGDGASNLHGRGVGGLLKSQCTSPSCTDTYGLYAYFPSTYLDSKFTRWVVIQWVNDAARVANREVRVTATVTWKTIFSTKKVEIVEQLTNW